MPVRLLIVFALVGLAGCVPYTVGSTPATVAPREIEPSAMLQIASGRRDLDRDDEPGGAALMLGNEARLGLDERSDVGVRLIGLGSLTATYKRRLTGPIRGDAGTSLIVGAGVIGASHLHLEATVVASPGPIDGAPRVVPYGALRLQDLTPFSGDALDTTPALGLVVGGRFGWPDLAVSPEIGVFYSPSPLAGDDDVIVVPSVTVRGDRLRKALGL
ncbi:hypothetical protein [Rubrivirga marina]|uniref:Outer membrane protein beta-barrel domain-containing protein n=1 Tax=Rubrivirga marina TaxID=1196024 RepID=A0A271J0C7_9BACT|nr:hypothetical protein [Rubrivirga marina]PAP76504.1 hypothetical protein BSZ37_08650 [Rubrivirga marina]